MKILLLLVCAINAFLFGEDSAAPIDGKYYCVYMKSSTFCALAVFNRESLPEILYYNNGTTKIYASPTESSYPEIKITNLLVILQLQPVTISWVALTAGRASLIKRGENIVDVKGRTGIKVNRNGQLLIGFWCDDLSILPKTSQSIESFGDREWDILWAAKKVSFLNDSNKTDLHEKSEMPVP